MIRNSWNVGKIQRMRKQCVPGLPSPCGRPGNEATYVGAHAQQGLQYPAPVCQSSTAILALQGTRQPLSHRRGSRMENEVGNFPFRLQLL